MLRVLSGDNCSGFCGFVGILVDPSRGFFRTRMGGGRPKWSELRLSSGQPSLVPYSFCCNVAILELLNFSNHKMSSNSLDQAKLSHYIGRKHLRNSLSSSPCTLSAVYSFELFLLSLSRVVFFVITFPHSFLFTT